jgi:hypothetical protein
VCTLREDFRFSKFHEAQPLRACSRILIQFGFNTESSRSRLFASIHGYVTDRNYGVGPAVRLITYPNSDLPLP